MRQVFAREAPVANDGPHYPLPRREGDGPRQAAEAVDPPLRAELPIYLAAEGPKNIALAGELCDGWLALFFSPGTPTDAWYRQAPAARRATDFEVAATVPLVFGEAEAAADALRPQYALYFGGMGARSANFHADVAARLGYEDGGRQGPGALPRGPQGRRRRGDPARADRRARADRPARPRARPARRVGASRSSPRC